MLLVKVGVQNIVVVRRGLLCWVFIEVSCVV